MAEKPDKEVVRGEVFAFVRQIEAAANGRWTLGQSRALIGCLLTNYAGQILVAGTGREMLIDDIGKLSAIAIHLAENRIMMDGGGDVTTEEAERETRTGVGVTWTRDSDIDF